MNDKKFVSQIHRVAKATVISIPLFVVSGQSSADVIGHLESGETLRNAVSLEARKGDGFTISELSQALSQADTFRPSLMLLYAAEEHPTKACRYIEAYKQANLGSAVSEATLIALKNSSAGATTLVRCAAKFQPQLAADVYVDVLIEAPGQAQKVLDIYQTVNPDTALISYRKGMQTLSGSQHCPALSQLCSDSDEIKFSLAGTPKHGLAGGEAYLQYAISTEFTDNVNRSGDAISESSLIFEPAFAAKQRLGAFSFVAAGDAALAASRETDAQAYADFAGVLGTQYQTNMGVEVALGGAYRQSHDQTGLGRDEGGADITSLDRWERTSTALSFKSNAPQSQISIELALDGQEYNYLNNESETGFLNRMERNASFNVKYALSELTHFEVGTRQLSVSYDEEPTASRDFDQHTHWAGISSSITGALDFHLKGGLTDRNIAAIDGSPERRGFWDAGLDWTPAPQTRITLSTIGDNSQSLDANTRYLKNYRAEAKWHNDWLSAGKWSTDISVAGLRSEHIGRATPREDETISYAIQFNRKIGTNALISANFTRDERESNVAVNEYLRDTATVTMSTSF